MLYAMKDCANLRIDKASNNGITKPVLYANYARTSTLEFSAESVFAYSKSSKAVRFDDSREGTFTTEMQVFDPSMIALLFGKEFEVPEDGLPISKREVLRVVNGTCTMEGSPKSGSLVVFKVDPKDQVTHIAEQTLAANATSANTYTLSEKKLTLNTTETFPDNNGYVVLYYLVDSPVKSFTVDNVTFPDGYVIYGDTAIRGTNQVDEYVQFQLLNVKPQSNVTLSMDASDVTTLSITWDIMADGSGNMMHFAQITE